MRIVIALGGNALLQRGEVPDAFVQLSRVEHAARAIALAAREHDVIVTHGNGPQIGLLALESGDDVTLTRPYPLDALGAETQGLLGYWLQQTIANAAIDREVVAIITQTVVSIDDPAFAAPAKFVGAVYSKRQADSLTQSRGWTMALDNDAWRRVVASPMPLRIVESSIINTLATSNVIVICAGGGGIPVVETASGLQGVEAVVDKDHAAALLASELGADKLLLLTDVPAVIADFGTERATPIGATSAAALSSSSFAAGSMGPKVAAACRFVKERDGIAAIGALDDLAAVLAGSAGTQIGRE